MEVPQEEFPQYNFMGLILGPRGHYISKLQERTKTKIAIKVCGAFLALDPYTFRHLRAKEV